MLACVLVVATGGAYAAGAASGPKGQITACYVKKGTDRGDVRLLLKGKCTRKEGKVIWNQRGPAGDAGPRGPAGADGEEGLPATRLFARVSGAGELLSGSPGATATTLSTGDYEVSWGSQDLTDCAVVATVSSGAFGQGLIRRSISPTATNNVRIITQATDASPLNNGFDVAAFC